MVPRPLPPGVGLLLAPEAEEAEVLGPSCTLVPRPRPPPPHYELPHCKTSPPKTAASFGCINTCFFAIIDLMWVGSWSNMIRGEPRWSNVVKNGPKRPKVVQNGPKMGQVEFWHFFFVSESNVVGCKVV